MQRDRQAVTALAGFLVLTHIEILRAKCKKTVKKKHWRPHDRNPI
jgi:hypothetical protein